MTMSNGTDSDKTTPAERLAELAMILASAMLRLGAKRVTGLKKREISRDNCLGCPVETRPPAVDL